MNIRKLFTNNLVARVSHPGLLLESVSRLVILCVLLRVVAVASPSGDQFSIDPRIAVRADDAELAEYLAVDLNQQVLELLRESTRRLELRKTTVTDVVPGFSVEPVGELAWPEAVARAKATYAGDPARQALFLRKFLPVGSPESWLDQIPYKPDPYSFGSPGRSSLSFTLALPGSAGASSSNQVHPGPARPGSAPQVELRFVIGSSHNALVEPASLILHNFEIAGCRHDWLTFDVDDKLKEFARTVAYPAMSLKVMVGGNTTGTDGTNYFWGMVTDKNGRLQQTIGFSPALEITRLYVNDPVTSKPRYREEYEAGKLRRRIHYGERVTAQGTEQIVTSTQEFPTSANHATNE